VLRRSKFTGVRSVQVDGHELQVRSMGIGGPVFVLVHGIGVSGRYFLPLAEVLARQGTVHLVDMPGFGATRKPRRRLSLADFARLVAGALDRLGVGPAVLVGQSMGCQVVVELALLRPDTATSLVLLGPTVNRSERTAWQQGLRLLQDSLRETPRINAVVFSDYARCGPRWYLKTLPEMLGQRPEERIAGVQVPVLILRGEHDPIAPEYWIRELARACAKGSVASIGGAAHVAMFRRPEEVAAYCRELAVRGSAGQTGKET
jgi:pimeloyl-ACP methyl ester carboxylesterase